ncbi:MAG: TrbI/VirB10 family protein [Qipengyuania vulgaris]
MTEGANAAARQDRALPIVAGRAGNTGVWIFGAGLAIVAALLFYALEVRRASLSSPDVLVPTEAGAGSISSPPELAIPDGRDAPPDFSMFVPVVPVEPQELAPPPSFTMPPAGPPRRISRPAPPPEEDFEDFEEEPEPSMRDTLRRASRQAPQPSAVQPAEPALPEPAETERKHLARFDNPSTTVPKGTVIHAVLESALDSTRPGAVRAIVSRDVSSFDGTRVLIPRGSRLIGTYNEGIARGQKRALVQWTRLMLPEGKIMELDSPSADPLGRAGVKGKVDSHFFARFGDALMRSILDVGVQAAGRGIGGDTVIVNLPNSAEITGSNSQTIQPTLKVKHGTSVSVFVAHDLDFSARFR